MSKLSEASVAIQFAHNDVGHLLSIRMDRRTRREPAPVSGPRKRLTGHHEATCNSVERITQISCLTTIAGSKRDALAQTTCAPA
ncbi:hypothetical protein J6590_004805 [Homalodisca vitripennis]|nr:hypothetical protein J6590_004805 [Homalodisca vitripennis]